MCVCMYVCIIRMYVCMYIYIYSVCARANGRRSTAETSLAPAGVHNIYIEHTTWRISLLRLY